MGTKETDGKQPPEDDRAGEAGKETRFVHRVAIAVGIVLLFAWRRRVQRMVLAPANELPVEV